MKTLPPDARDKSVKDAAIAQRLRDYFQPADAAHDAPARQALIEQLEWENADLRAQNRNLLGFADQLRDQHSEALEVNERHFGKAIQDWEECYREERRQRRAWMALAAIFFVALVAAVLVG